MTRHQRTLNWQTAAARVTTISVFATVLMGLFSISGSAMAQDAGLESLKRQSLPWYDAQTEQVKPVELEARDDPRSGLRGTIAEKTKKKKKKANRNWTWDWGLSEGLGTFLYWLLWIVLGVAFAILVVWVVRNIDVKQPSAREETKSGRSLAQSVAQLPFQVEVGDEDFRSLAAKAFHANDYRQAIIWLFSHVLISLDQKNLIRLKKGKTNRQYLRELASERQLSSYYADVMVPFEATFFGDKDLNREQFASCWDGLNHFEQQVNASGETP
jgi:hypothetical protein